MNTIRTYNLNTIEGRRMARKANGANFSQKATAMATAYGAMKLKGIDSGIQDLNSSMQASLGVTEDIRAIVAANAAPRPPSGWRLFYRSPARLRR